MNLLTEPHQKQFVEFMDRARKAVAETIMDQAENVLANCYTDYAQHLDSDVWINYREHLRRELQGGLYKSVTDSSDGHWAKSVRAMILHEHREELVKAFNQDLLGEIKLLKLELARVRYL